MRKIQLLTLLFFLQLGGIGQVAAASEHKTIEGSVSPEIILYYINEHRAKKHLPPLKMNSMMSSVAKEHSRNMAAKTIPFGHTYYNKRFKYLLKEIKECTAAAENVAYWRTNAKNLVDAWIASPGHRRNIEGNYNLTGIGIAYSQKKGWAYYTELFAHTKSSNKLSLPIIP